MGEELLLEAAQIVCVSVGGGVRLIMTLCTRILRYVCSSILDSKMLA